MPPPSSNTQRKIAPISRSSNQKGDVWHRTLEHLALSPLSSKHDMSTANGLPGPSPATPSSRAPAQQLTILDLPVETQRCIFSHANSQDLIALSLVSKHFRVLAAEQLYRAFNILFPDEDDPANDCPIDSLAGGLETFVTSEYDYAQHLRAIRLETMSGGDKGERSYSQYHYDVSCGKFMSTLLLLTLRKAQSLETFKWDIRVELSREVYRALHKISPLQHLHLRMHAGSSVYQIPPALPASNTTVPAPLPSFPTSHVVSVFSPPPPPSFPPAATNFTNSSNSFSIASKVSAKVQRKALKSILPTPPTAPATLSGFTHLKTLSILDMDTLDYIDEIKTCIFNSSSTLNSLQISFSDALANRSRKPPPEVHSDDDSDQEDDLGNVILPPGGPIPPSGLALDQSGPYKSFYAQEEKKRQEAVLGRIFGVGPGVAKPKASSAKVEPEKKFEDDFRKKLLKSLSNLIPTLMQPNQTEAEKIAALKNLSGLADSAAKHYSPVDDGKTKGKASSSSSGSTTAKATPASSVTSNAGDENVPPAPVDGPGLFDEPEKKKASDSDPAAHIDIEEPEGSELVLEDGPQTDEIPTPKDADTSEEDPSLIEFREQAERAAAQANKKFAIAYETEKSRHDYLKAQAELRKARVAELEATSARGAVSPSHYADLVQAKSELKTALENSENGLKQVEKLCLLELRRNKGSTKGHEMSTYIRSTRGISLNHLAIYLVPLKANVLTKSIDLYSLRSITLLNVGPQVLFWNTLIKESTKNGPLPLSKIFTDNVTLPFLVLVAQLPKVEELLMLERTGKTKVESTTVKSPVTMEHIRKLALKKHAATLKVLMIRNEIQDTWDMNVKSMVLLADKAKNLEELTVTLNFRTIHTLLQFMPGLVSLHALHIWKVNVQDDCAYVLAELTRFTIDNISHNPSMKLEFVAYHESVTRLVKRKPIPTDEKGKGKAKEVKKKETSLLDMLKGSWKEGVLSTYGKEVEALMESDSEDDEAASLGRVSKVGSKVDVIEGIAFSDICNVRIFEREVISGRL